MYYYSLLLHVSICCNKIIKTKALLKESRSKFCIVQIGTLKIPDFGIFFYQITGLRLRIQWMKRCRNLNTYVNVRSITTPAVFSQEQQDIFEPRNMLGVINKFSWQCTQPLSLFYVMFFFTKLSNRCYPNFVQSSTSFT